MFAAGRAFEQVRNSICYPNLNVKIGATHAGISVGEDGATHQCLEDIGLMRTIPNMVIINPADKAESILAVEAAIKHNGPVYLRFGRLAVPEIFDRETYNFEIGKGVEIAKGSDVSICLLYTSKPKQSISTNGRIKCNFKKTFGCNRNIYWKYR